MIGRLTNISEGYCECEFERISLALVQVVEHMSVYRRFDQQEVNEDGERVCFDVCIAEGVA